MIGSVLDPKELLGYPLLSDENLSNAVVASAKVGRKPRTASS
jgi:hypothetical protein